MTKLIAFLALAFTSPVIAAQGTAYLDFSGISTGYDLQHEGDTLTGSVSNLGDTVGRVNIVKQGDVWTGTMGLYRVQTRNLQSAKNGNRRIEVQVFPGGSHTFTVQVKGDTVRVQGLLANGEMVYSEVNSKRELTSYNRFVTMSLKPNRSGNYSGTTLIRRGGMYDNIPTTLKTQGTLAPAVVAQQDPVLFTLVYLIPLNLYK